MIRRLKALCLLIALAVFLLTGCGEQETLSEKVVADTEGSGDAAGAGEDIGAGQDGTEQGSDGGTSAEEVNADETGTDRTKENGISESGTPADETGADGTNAESEAMREPVKVKGIYVTGPVAGTERMDELITLVEETELNAMVIDIKNDEGKVTYKMQSDTVLEIESGVRYISDVEALVKKLHEKDIYLIARIVAFKDPHLAEKKPELSLKTENGKVYRDRNGEAWVNPYKKEVWDYLLEIGTQAVEAGFDEIQFDYIRFSTDGKANEIDYGEEGKNKTKKEAISDFTKYAYDTLRPLGVMVSADVFGTIIDNENDAEIVGQNYQEMAEHLDYICPMVYPSHYMNGVYGIDVPDKAPYDTVYNAMCASKEKLEKAGAGNDTGASAGSGAEAEAGTKMGSGTETETSSSTDGVRVWIQDFTASWLKDYLPYGAKEVRAQIQAVYDAGYEEWILWNARMNYTEGALLPYWTGAEAADTEGGAAETNDTADAFGADGELAAPADAAAEANP